MNNEPVWMKFWNIIYPLVAYFLLDLLAVWLVQYLMGFRNSDGAQILHPNVNAVATIVFLVLSIGMCWLFFRRDLPLYATWIYKKPACMGLLLVIGALASHGLSALVSLVHIDSIIGSYAEVENTIFGAHPVLVILQAVLLAPISEELLFRGLIFKRMEKYTGRFWVSALVSSLLFGIYHMNLAQGVFAFLFGLLACMVYDKVQNLLAPILLHVGGNLVSVILVYTGFAYPSTAVYIIIMIACLAAAFLLYFFLIRPVKKQTEQEL